MDSTRQRVLQGQNNSAERPAEIRHMGRKQHSKSLPGCVPAEQKNPLLRCPKRQWVKNTRSKKVLKKEKKKKASLHWDNLGPMEKAVIPVASLLLTRQPSRLSIIKALRFPADKAQQLLLYTHMQICLQFYKAFHMTSGCCPRQHEALMSADICVFVFFFFSFLSHFILKKKKRKTVTCSQPQFHSVTNRLEVLLTLKLYSWSWPLSSQHHCLPRETGSEEGLVWNSA